MEAIAGAAPAVANPMDAAGQPLIAAADVLAEEAGRRFFEFLDTFRVMDYLAPGEQPPLSPIGNGLTMEDVDSDRSLPEYVKQLSTLKQLDWSTIYVNYEHLTQFNPDLAESIMHQYYRFEPYLRKAVFEFILKYQPEEARTADGKERPFWLSVYNLPVIQRLRELRASRVGTLVAISGTVTRTSEARPELIYGTFVCDMCQTTVSGVEQQFKYTEPKCMNCNNKDKWTLDIPSSTFVDWQKIKLQENSNEIPAGSLPRTIDVIVRNDIVELAKAGDKCIFTGTLIVVPEPSTLAASGERVEQFRRRDAMQNDGVTGANRQYGQRELTYRMSFLALHIAPVDVNYSAIRAASVSNASTGRIPGMLRPMEEEEDGAAAVLESFSAQEKEEIFRLKGQPRLLQRLSECIAPNVFGHFFVKRGILLMMLGGVHKKTQEGISLRGDLNCCIVGDPSCAKSQFLKYVVNFLPRAIYTSGKASSAAGLTASVAKDSETGEFCIEAGALMLADNAVCCIDEFDKMDLKDQVAIHEAMEQQTISISKAGIQATLNARTSILAAANPIGGRYDTSKTLKQNLQLSAPIMSRFDLFFVILDRPDRDTDARIARFVVENHSLIGRLSRSATEPVTPPVTNNPRDGGEDEDEEQHEDPEARASGNQPLSQSQLLRFIKYARTINPKLTPEAKILLVKMYRDLRQKDATSLGRSAYRITVRQLESLIRLSEAMARLNLDDYVRESYVKDAAELLDKSILHVEDKGLELEEEEEEKGNNTRNELQSGDANQNREGRDGDEGQGLDGENRVDGNGNKAQDKITITFGEFKQIVMKVVVHMRRMEVRQGGFGKGAASRNEIVKYLLELREAQEGGFRNESELRMEAKRYQLVLKRMVSKERILIELPDQEEGVSKEDRLLVVHPNFATEE